MMNKFTMVLGAAAVATLAGCKDPDYARRGATPQDEVKNADTTITVAPAPQSQPATVKPIVVEPAPEVKPVAATKPAPVAKPAEPEYTTYVVQNGDYLAKISKKFNVTIASIKRLNPSIKKDVVRVGQKLKIPGKSDAVVQAAAPAKATAAKPAAKTAAKVKKGYQPYKGATKEYVVKSGDTLGSIAYGNGCNIRQLKELNSLTKDSVRIGQKLKVPADGAAAKSEKVEAKPAVAAEKKATASVAVAPAKPAAAAPVAPATAAPAAPVEAAPAPAAEAPAAAPVEAKSAAPATTSYLVQEGDDMTSVSIRWGVSAAEIRELNNLGENDQLVPGQTIRLPADAQQ